VRFLFRGNEPRYRVPPKVVDTLAIVVENSGQIGDAILQIQP
jgi:hypothetical protein